MDKSVSALLGGASALALLSGGGASAVASPVSETGGLKPAQSYAELLDPIPNAVNTLRAEQTKAGKAVSEPLELAQYLQFGYPHHHHHHHHHYSYWDWRHRFYTLTQ